MRLRSDFAETKGRQIGQHQVPEPRYLQRLRARRHARSALELEGRLRNPWRESKGRGGALEAWG